MNACPYHHGVDYISTARKLWSFAKVLVGDSVVAWLQYYTRTEGPEASLRDPVSLRVFLDYKY